MMIMMMMMLMMVMMVIYDDDDDDVDHGDNENCHSEDGADHACGAVVDVWVTMMLPMIMPVC